MVFVFLCVKNLAPDPAFIVILSKNSSRSREKPKIIARGGSPSLCSYSFIAMGFVFLCVKNVAVGTSDPVAARHSGGPTPV